MAREVHEREDLLRDATALVPRIELRLALGGQQSEFFAGFRGPKALSLYFGTDPVYHFNGRQQLRRAFVDNRLIKANRGKLVTMHRQRSDERTEMLSHELTPDEADQFCRALVARLDELRGAMGSECYEVVGQVPTGGDALPLLVEWLQQFQRVEIADSPRVR